jgi:alpha-tubulin suppressor-like RCC1 family protein
LHGQFRIQYISAVMRSSGFLALVLVASSFAACGGDSGDPSPVPIVELAAPEASSTTYAATAAVSGRIFTARALASATVRAGGGAPAALELAPVPGGYAFGGQVELAIGANELAIEAIDDRDQRGDAAAEITRLADDAAPEIAIEFPRDGQAVRTRRAIVRGTVRDQSSVARVEIDAGGQTVAAVIERDGSFQAAIELAPAMNELVVRAADGFGNRRGVPHRIYFGQRIAAGGAHGGAIRDGRIYTWGRNNLGQTGLGYQSHETRAAFCTLTYGTPREAALCNAVTITAIDAICGNPGFATPAPPDSPEAQACRAAARARRDAACDAAGAAAPANCKTAAATHLPTVCDAAYGLGTPASGACEASVVCDSAYAAGSPERASCTAVAGAVPSVFPTPATPYAPVAVGAFSPTASPPAPAGGGVPYASLGVSFTSISFNQNASTAIDSAGRVWSWGANNNGMLCLGDALPRTIPHRVDEFGEPGTAAIAIARGYDHVLILRSDGSVWGCGLNNVGQLGDGTSGDAASRSLPTRVLGLPANIVQVAAASQSSYALAADGQVYAWGRNQYGNLGNGTASSSTAAAPMPALVPGLAGVVMLATGRDHVLAATAAGDVLAWGLNASHQVNGTEDDVLSPVAIAHVADARAVYANGNQGFYEDPAGRLLGWGQNGSGNLGIPEDDDQPAPSSPVFGVTGVLDVSIGPLQGFALRGAQEFGWGWSFHGSLGAGPSAIHTWPYRTPLLVQFP